MDKGCDFCIWVGPKGKLYVTRDGKNICINCADKNGFCEVCGSIRNIGQLSLHQTHYEEDCFK
jgi:hypothetical protein